MFKKKYILSVIIALQLLIPAHMIVQREVVLKKGELYKFKTAPVDPYDAFRGRYVALGIDAAQVEYKAKSKFAYGQIVYAALRKDVRNYATIVGVSLTPPEDKAYIKAKAGYMYADKLRLILPFDRFYMNEYKAPKAEQLYREYSAVNKRDAYIAVRVLNGQAVLEDLYLADKPIAQYFDGQK